MAERPGTKLREPRQPHTSNWISSDPRPSFILPRSAARRPRRVSLEYMRTPGCRWLRRCVTVYPMSGRTLTRAACAGVAWMAAACAGKVPPVDLTAARAELASAREAGAASRAQEQLRLAEAHLAEAEALLRRRDGARVPRAEMLGQMAVLEARLAAAAARQREPAPAT